VLLVLVPLTVLGAAQGERIVTALETIPLAAALGAVAAHLATLVCRCEAWRLAVNAIEGGGIPRGIVHAAAALGFAAGAVQPASAAPVRAAALRSIAGSGAPPLAATLVAEGPVLLLEAALAAFVLAAAVWTLPVAPGWAPVVAAAGCLGALAALRAAVRRFGHRRAATGLLVLADVRRRAGLALLVVVVTALGLARSWIVLAGFGLPHGLASVALLFVALGVFGLLPIGPMATPGATLAVFGPVDPATAAAAGIAVSATSVAAVAAYCGIATPLSLIGRRRVSDRPAGSTSRTVAPPVPRP
jgi:hypothetical protein